MYLVGAGGYGKGNGGSKHVIIGTTQNYHSKVEGGSSSVKKGCDSAGNQTDREVGGAVSERAHACW